MPRRPQFFRGRQYRRQSGQNPRFSFLNNATININAIRAEPASSMGVTEVVTRISYVAAIMLSGIVPRPTVRLSRRVVMSAPRWLASAARTLDHLLSQAPEHSQPPAEGPSLRHDAESLIVTARQLLRDNVLTPNDFVVAPADSPLQAERFVFDGIDVGHQETKKALEGEEQAMAEPTQDEADPQGLRETADVHVAPEDPLYLHPHALGDRAIGPDDNRALIPVAAPPTPPPTPQLPDETDSFWARPAISPEEDFDIEAAVEEHGRSLLDIVIGFYTFVGEQPVDAHTVWVDQASRFFVPTEPVQALARTARAATTSGNLMPVWLIVLALNLAPTIFATALGEASMFTSLTTHLHLVGGTDHHLRARVLISGELPDFGDQQLRPVQLDYVIWLGTAGLHEPALLLVTFANGQHGVGLRPWFGEARVVAWLEDWYEHDLLLPFPLA